MSEKSKSTKPIDAFLAQKRRALHLPGLAITVVQHSRVIYQQGLGMAGPSRAMTPQTPLIIGSLSKSFTALAVMQLVEAGRLRLDDPVQHHVPWFCLADRDTAASITIKHLLTHTSGISRYAGRALLGRHSGKTIEQSVRGLRNLHLSQPLGTFQYSNINYVIAGFIVEVVSGQCFADYVQQHIFSSLGMLNSHIHEDSALRGGLASGHRWWFGMPLPYKAAYLEDAVPAAFITASAEDLGHYMLALLNDGDSVLSSDGVRELHRPQTATASPGSDYALGWRVEKLGDTEIIRHGGEVSNFLAEMVLVPGQQLGVVVLMNASNGMAPLALGSEMRLASSLVRLLLGMPQPHRRLSFRSFYAALNTGLVGLSLYQVWSLAQLLRRFNQRGSSVLGVVALVEVFLGVIALRRIPRMADSPWSLLKIYVPDITFWLTAFFGCSLLKCCVYLFRQLSKRV